MTGLKLFAGFLFTGFVIGLVASDYYFVDKVQTLSAKPLESYEIPEISVAAATADNVQLMEVFGRLDPKFFKKKDTAEAEAKKALEQIVHIDKTLLPNFQAFDEEHQISLVGVFNEKGSFAVVQLLNYATKEPQFTKLELNHQIGSYTLTTMSDNFIELTSDKGVIQLALFKQDS